MWVETLRPHVGGVSLMRYALNFLVVIAAALLWTITFSASTYAADASWNQSGAIRYNNQDYQGPKTADGKIPPGLAQGVQYYEHITPETDQGSKARILALPAGVDPKDTTQLQYSEYDYDRGASDAQKYTNGTSPRQLTIDRQPASVSQKEQTSCVVNGIGYIICPIMNFIADTMDKVYDLLKRFLTVAPLTTDREGGLFKAWQLMLAFANVLFVIGFLVIIYSYVTSQGVNQYDLRSIIPRLIVAAVLINVSYYICALAVDASNILGSNLQDIFNNIRKDMVPNDVTNNTTWTQAATFILSGGTIGVLAGLSAVAISGTASLTFLIPVLTIAATAILVAVVVLAARQALITILIVVAPLAFAAFILPSTQKYFDKWKSLFMTMLIMYPIFSVLFGGSQLAATLIAQNANSPEVIIFAMFIQVMPLVLTPFLIKLSGGLLGKFAGMVNNPAKGLGDRANNWGKQKREEAKDRRLQEPNKGWARTPGLAFTQKLNNRKRKREGMQKYHQAMQQAQFDDSEAGKMVARNMAQAQMAQSTADNFNKSHFEELKRKDPGYRDAAINEKLSSMQHANNQAQMEKYLQEVQSKKGAAYHGVAGTPAESMVAKMNALSHESHAVANALQLAKEQEKLEYSTDMVKGTHADALQTAAAGITGDKGKAQAAARAVQEMRADFGKSSAAMKEMMDHFKVTGGEVEKMANPNNTEDVVKVSKDGKTKFTFKAGDEYTTDAAIEALYEKKGNYASMKQVLVRSGLDSHEEYLTTIISGVGSGMTKKAPWLGGKNLDIITQGKIQSAQDLDNMVRATIADGKFKAEWMATGDSTGLNDIAAIVNDSMNHSGLNGKQSAAYSSRVANMRKMAKDTLENKNLEGSLTDEARTQLRMIAGDIPFKRS